MEFLDFGGLAVAAAESGPDGFNRAVELRPDLVLTELRIPGMGGFELTQRLRAHPALRDTLILAVTASGGAADRVRALAAGCHAVITKPFDLRALIVLLNVWLAARLATPPTSP